MHTILTARGYLQLLKEKLLYAFYILFTSQHVINQGRRALQIIKTLLMAALGMKYFDFSYY